MSPNAYRLCRMVPRLVHKQLLMQQFSKELAYNKAKAHYMGQ